MIASIVGNYLQEKGLITREQFLDLLTEQRKVRVKLGLIAVAEGLMTQEETERVNKLQAVMDKRFGDIAVEKGFLTEGQVEALLKKQGNAYLSFAQALENQKLMNVEQLELYMQDYQSENDLTISDMEDLKSDDIDRILPLYLTEEHTNYQNIAGTALRMLMRCVDTEIYLEKAYMASALEADNGALQRMEGEYQITCAMSGRGNGLLPVAGGFAGETFEKPDEDAMDAIGELLNCANGMYAAALSQSGVKLELFPPEYSAKINKFEGEMLVLPLCIKESNVNFLIAINHDLEMK